MGHRFHLVQRKNYSRKKAKPSTKPSKNPAAIPAGTTKESVLATQPSAGCIDETGSSVLTPLDDNVDETSRDWNTATSTVELPPRKKAKLVESPVAIPAGTTYESVSSIQPSIGSSVPAPLVNDDVIAESSIDRNTATSTVDLPPNDQTGSADDVEIPLATDDLDDGSRTKQNTSTSRVEMSFGNLNEKATCTALLSDAEHTVNGGTLTTEVSTQTDLVDICATELESSTSGVFTAEASTQTEPVDIIESTGGGQSDSVATTSTTIAVGTSQQEMPYIMCEGNADEKFLPLVNKHEGVFRDATGNHVVAYYDSYQKTIRHVRCLWKISPSSPSNRCTHCRNFRDNILRSGLSRLLRQTEGDKQRKCYVDSHTTYKNLSTSEKHLRMRNVHSAYRVSKHKVSELQSKLDKMIEKDSVDVDSTTHRGLLTIANAQPNTKENSGESFSSIFWEQQLKAASVKGAKGMRWHPAVIRWCLYLHHKSSGCYSTLRNSGVLKLPSDRTLRDYRHASSSKPGFSVETDLELLDVVAQQRPKHLAKYVGLVLDEMHIKEGLYFDKHTGNLVGYSDLGEVNNLLSEYEDHFDKTGATPRPLSKCMLVFMIRGLFTSMKFPYVQFPAVSTKGADIFPLVREAIRRLTMLGLTVVTVTCDGASDNRKMFSMHNSDSALSYKTVNVYTSERREIFFISDPPHLIKTIRNCFARGKLWCCGHKIDWNLIVDLYKRNTGAITTTPGLSLVPKIKYEHIYLTNFSKMRVDLAAQVLSESVAKALYFSGNEDAYETAYFIDKMDKLFDMLNVSSFCQGKHNRKPFQDPIRGPGDFRMKFLKEILGYLNHWKKSVDKRRGPFDAAERRQMMLSDVTLNGIRITVHSLLELIPFLFSIPGVTCFLSEKLSQDALEKFFGCQRQKGRTNDNPKVHEFLCNTQSLRVIDSIKVDTITGNCRGTKRKAYDLEMVDLNKPLKKRRRHYSD